MKINWKLLSIILIAIVVLESLFIGWGISLGFEAVEDENICAYNICEDYDVYSYDMYSNLCHCYKDNEIVLSKVITDGDK